MFDLRYHVASLAAVFIALIIGILVGVGLSGSGVNKADLRLARLQRDSAARRDAGPADPTAEGRRRTPSSSRTPP